MADRGIEPVGDGACRDRVGAVGETLRQGVDGLDEEAQNDSHCVFDLGLRALGAKVAREHERIFEIPESVVVEIVVCVAGDSVITEEEQQLIGAGLRRHSGRRDSRLGPPCRQPRPS